MNKSLSPAFAGVLGAGVALLQSGAALAEVRTESGWRKPLDASLDGWRIDSLIDITIVFTGILFAIMVGWMLIACVKHGWKHRAEYTHGEEKKWTTAKLGIAALIFLGVDGNLFVNSTLDLHNVFENFDKPLSNPDVVRVEINARQWAWNIRYAGPDGEFATPDDPVTFNELKIPVDTPIVVQVGASDVLHSFYLPHFRVKRDVVPGSVATIWFQPTQTGEFEIACAQHCGVNHYKMRGKVTVVPKEEFKAWVKQASRDSAQVVTAEDPEAQWGWKWQKVGS